MWHTSDNKRAFKQLEQEYYVAIHDYRLEKPRKFLERLMKENNLPNNVLPDVWVPYYVAYIERAVSTM